MPTVRDVANFFLSKSEENTEWAITHLKLQKLVYYAQAWFVTLYPHRNFLFDEQIEAWVHGPVCRELYNEYRYEGYNVLTLADNVDEPNFDPEESDALEAVWAAYGKMDGKYLEALTHNEDPWLQARQNLNEYDYSTNVITIEAMRNYYSQRI